MKIKKIIPVVGFVAVVLGAGGYHLFSAKHKISETIATSNGRIEAQSIDLATRSGGRLLDVLVEEGRMVNAGDVVATIDLNYLSAALDTAKANARVAAKQQAEAAATIQQAQSALDYANKEFQRAERLVKNGAASHSRVDSALNQKQSAESALSVAQQRVAATAEAVEAANAEVARQQDLLSDQHLKAPRAGRVLYKLAEPGEVLAAGGKVATLLDLSDVYMTAFFPIGVAGKLRLNDEARIIVDAYPDLVIPARISYVSPEAQFTPRQVETSTEREKMTFRVKLQVPVPLLKKYMDQVKTGVPGVAYVRTDSTVAWPDFLTVSAKTLAESKE